MQWCLSDVLKLQDDVAFRSRQDDWGDSETTTIFPDGQPAEQMELPLEPPVQPQSQENVPTPAPVYPSAPGQNDSSQTAPAVQPFPRWPDPAGSVQPAVYGTDPRVPGGARAPYASFPPVSPGAY